MRRSSWVLVASVLVGGSMLARAETSPVASLPAAGSAPSTAQQKPGKLGPEERQQMRSKLQSMTPEERRAFFESKRQEWLKNLPPEQRKKMEERRELRQKFLASLTPEQKEMWQRMHSRQGRMGRGGGGRRHHRGFGPNQTPSPAPSGN